VGTFLSHILLLVCVDCRSNTDRPFGTIEVNTFQASELANRKKVDRSLKLSLFGQLFQYLKNKDVTNYRVGLDDRAWSIKMMGFNAIDAGIFCFVSVTCYCDCVMNSHFSLILHFFSIIL
jgi:hypothetical protein